MSELHINVSM